MVGKVWIFTFNPSYSQKPLKSNFSKQAISTPQNITIATTFFVGKSDLGISFHISTICFPIQDFCIFIQNLAFIEGYFQKSHMHVSWISSSHHGSPAKK